jgi:hypothetical protein
MHVVAQTELLAGVELTASAARKAALRSLYETSITQDAQVLHPPPSVA